jgi:hypothetical protein
LGRPPQEVREVADGSLIAVEVEGQANRAGAAVTRYQRQLVLTAEMTLAFLGSLKIMAKEVLYEEHPGGHSVVLALAPSGVSFFPSLVNLDRVGIGVVLHRHRALLPWFADLVVKVHKREVLTIVFVIG